MATGTFDATTDRGKVRLYVGDWEDTANMIFTDGAIDAFLEQNSDSIWYAAADGCRAMSAKNASNAFILDIAGSLMIDKKQVAKAWLALAAKYEARASGSSAQLREFIDSYDIEMNDTGEDRSEYVGDLGT